METFLANDPAADPSGKYKVLANAWDWTVNLGYPCYNNPAISEVYDKIIITAMFANAATSEMTPEEAMTQADQKVRKIYDK